MAVSRAGQMPVEFEYLRCSGGAPESMLEAVAQYMHRFTSFKWADLMSTVDLSRPSPLLREFACKFICLLPTDFLGGRRGSLHTLRLMEVVLPQMCPALATVTHLYARYPEYTGSSDPGNRLFELFPQLETLHLYEPDETVWADPPAGPAPRTLMEVKLQATGPHGWDLGQLYTSWDLAFVQDVELDMQLDTGSCPATLFVGAKQLSMTFHMELDTALKITAALPDRRRRTLPNHYIPDVSVLGDILLADGVLEETHSLEVPLSVLGPVTAASPNWAYLKHLTVHVFPFDTYEESDYDPLGPHPRFRWNLLDRLCATPTLETLTLHVHSDDISGPSTLSDAQRLKTHLATMSGSTPQEVRVRGFTGDVVSAMMPPWESDSPKVIFC